MILSKKHKEIRASSIRCWNYLLTFSHTNCTLLSCISPRTFHASGRRGDSKFKFLSAFWICLTLLVQTWSDLVVRASSCLSRHRGNKSATANKKRTVCVTNFVVVHGVTCGMELIRSYGSDEENVSTVSVPETLDSTLDSNTSRWSSTYSNYSITSNFTSSTSETKEIDEAVRNIMMDKDKDKDTMTDNNNMRHWLARFGIESMQEQVVLLKEEGTFLRIESNTKNSMIGQLMSENTQLRANQFKKITLRTEANSSMNLCGTGIHPRSASIAIWVYLRTAVMETLKKRRRMTNSSHTLNAQRRQESRKYPYATHLQTFGRTISAIHHGIDTPAIPSSPPASTNSNN